MQDMILDWIPNCRGKNAKKDTTGSPDGQNMESGDSLRLIIVL